MKSCLDKNVFLKIGHFSRRDRVSWREPMRKLFPGYPLWICADIGVFSTLSTANSQKYPRFDRLGMKKAVISVENLQNQCYCNTLHINLSTKSCRKTSFSGKILTYPQLFL